MSYKISFSVNYSIYIPNSNERFLFNGKEVKQLGFSDNVIFIDIWVSLKDGGKGFIRIQRPLTLEDMLNYMEEQGLVYENF